MKLNNLFYFKKTSILFSILFSILPLVSTYIQFEDATGGFFEWFMILLIWVVFYVAFLLLYGIPPNFFATRKIKKSLLENNLGLRLVEEVSRLKEDEYGDWNKKNNIYFDTVKNYVIDKLTKLNESSIDQVKRIDEKIIKLKKTIKEEKSTTNEILKRHPFIKTLKEIQNRSE